MPMKL